MEQYDQNYKEQRKKRLSVSDGKCAYTGSPGRIETHHNVPKGIGGTNLSGNLVPTVNHFHAYLHRIANVAAPEQFTRRQQASRALWQDPLNEDAWKQKKVLEAVDRVIIPQYVENLLTKFHGDIQSSVTIQTVIHDMTAIRDLTIENITLKAEKEKLQREVSELRSLLEQSREK